MAQADYGRSTYLKPALIWRYSGGSKVSLYGLYYLENKTWGLGLQWAFDF
ncbi:MAG: hypothetical protein LBC31_09850 [Treponema sp.]|jgi:hypothetical protein|nr:hypothetical protein [Treponema sp.]